VADDALPWWGLREPSSAERVRWRWSATWSTSTPLAGVEVLAGCLPSSGDRAKRALLALPALALPAASIAGVGSAQAVMPAPRPAVATQALSEANCLDHFGGTTQSLGLRAEGDALSVSVRYDCRLAGGGLKPLSGLPVAVHVTSAGGSSVLDGRTDAEGWADLSLTVPSGGVVSVVAEVPGFPAFANCEPTACLAGDPISGSLDLQESPAAKTSPSSGSGKTTPTATVTPPLSSVVGSPTTTGSNPASGSQDAGAQSSGTTSANAQGTTSPTSAGTASAGTASSTGTSPGTDGATPLVAARPERSPAAGSADTSSRPASQALTGSTAATSSDRSGSAPLSEAALSAGVGSSDPVQVLPVSTQAPEGSGLSGGLEEGAVLVALSACAAALALVVQRWRARSRLLGVAGGLGVPVGGLGAWGSVEIDDPPVEEPPKAGQDPPPTHASGGGVDYWIPER